MRYLNVRIVKLSDVYLMQRWSFTNMLDASFACEGIDGMPQAGFKIGDSS